MDVLFEFLSLGREDDLFLEHRGGRLKSFLGKNFENFGKELGDLLLLPVEAGKPLVEEEEEIARFDFEGICRDVEKTTMVERPKEGDSRAFAVEGRAAPVERKGVVGLALLRILVLCQKLIHPLKALFAGLRQVDLKEVGPLRFREV